MENIKTVVLGIGNILLGDEGVGIHVIKKLKEIDLPSSVLVIDGSTAGFKLFPVFETYKNCKFIIIDAIKAGFAADPDTNTSANNISDSKSKSQKSNPSKGDLYLIPLSDFYNLADSKYLSSDFISFHQTGLIDVLNLFHLTYKIKINGYLIGVNICESGDKDSIFKFSMILSREIEEKIPEIIDLIKKHM